MSEPMLTTIDNPYNPRTDYVKWLRWDRDNEYYTQEYLARMADLVIEVDDTTDTAMFDSAINQILENDELGIYKLV